MGVVSAYVKHRIRHLGNGLGWFVALGFSAFLYNIVIKCTTNKLDLYELVKNASYVVD